MIAIARFTYDDDPVWLSVQHIRAIYRGRREYRNVTAIDVAEAGTDKGVRAGTYYVDQTPDEAAEIIGSVLRARNDRP